MPIITCLMAPCPSSRVGIRRASSVRMHHHPASSAPSVRIATYRLPAHLAAPAETKARAGAAATAAPAPDPPACPPPLLCVTSSSAALPQSKGSLTHAAPTPPRCLRDACPPAAHATVRQRHTRDRCIHVAACHTATICRKSSFALWGWGLGFRVQGLGVRVLGVEGVCRV